MKHPLRIFEPNLLGRDFAIGDLHGAMPCFAQLLLGLNFDPTKDRMFSVADLVDRGPESLGCLELLKESWFNAVLANHEFMMLLSFGSQGEDIADAIGPMWLQNGGFWGYSAWTDADRLKRGETNIGPDTHRLLEMLPIVEELPYLITVKLKDGRRMHIIHAEFPPNETVTDEILEDPDEVRRIATTRHRNGDFILWGRHRFAPFCKEPLDNRARIVRQVKAQGMGYFNDKLSHIISGHTIVNHPMTILGQTDIDTGAYAACKSDAKSHKALTCVELDTWKFYQATTFSFKEVQPFTVNKADIS
jgi:serine/threonine protein phosphatase 1